MVLWIVWLSACGIFVTEDVVCLDVSLEQECPDVSIVASDLEGTTPDCSAGKVKKVLEFSHRSDGVRVTGLKDTAYLESHESCCYAATFVGRPSGCDD